MTDNELTKHDYKFGHSMRLLKNNYYSMKLGRGKSLFVFGLKASKPIEK